MNSSEMAATQTQAPISGQEQGRPIPHSHTHLHHKEHSNGGRNVANHEHVSQIEGQPKGRFSWMKKLMNNNRGGEEKRHDSAHRSFSRRFSASGRHEEGTLHAKDAGGGKTRGTNRTGAGYPLADSRSAVSGLSKEECGSNFTGDDKLSVAASVKSIKSGRTANIGARMSEISSLVSNSEPSGFSDTFSNKPLYSVQPSELDVDRVGSCEDDNYDRVSDYRSFGPAPSEYTAESVVQQQSAANSDLFKAPAVPRKFAQDAASMVTLASSIKSRRRRRSIDTNASTTAIAPASILERIAGGTSPAAGSLNGRSMSGTGSIGGNLSANGAEQESHSSVSIKS